MATATITPIRPPEVWMELRSLKRLKSLMVIHDEMSGRQLAKIAGYASHTYMQRILRGEVKTMESDPALLIAHYFKVPVSDLFLTRASTDPVSESSNAA